MPTPVYGFWLKVNGVDIGDHGAYPYELRGQWDAPALSYETVQMPAADGASVETDEPHVEPMDFVATVELIGDDVDDFEDNRDTLAYLLLGDANGNVQLSGGNRPDRYRNAKYVGPMTVEMLNVNEADVARATFKLSCLRPIQYATTDTTVSGSSGVDYACALGTWRSRPVITLIGATDPLVTYKNSSGGTVRTMQLEGTGDFVIDCDNETITIDGLDAPTALTAGDFIRLAPRDGDYLTSSWPTLRTSSGSLSAVYRQAWF